MQVKPAGGLPGAVGERFGAFEPRFYGVSFVLQTPEVFQAWLAQSGVTADSGAPALPPFEAVCLQTAIEHEKRHFHDALLSPFANAILRLRMTAAFNGVNVFNRGMRSHANCLPIPAKKWMAMNRQRRDAWLASIADDLPASLGSSALPLSLPYADQAITTMRPEISNDDDEAELHGFAKATIGAYALSEDLMRGPVDDLRTDTAFDGHAEDETRAVEATMTPRNVFEASALAVQLQAAWTNIGADAANALLKYLLKSQLGYARTFRWIALQSAPSEQPGMMDPTRVSAVTVWCLLGDQKSRAALDPALRLMRVLSVLADSGGISTTESIADLWDEWDRSTGVKGWRTCIAEMREQTAAACAEYSAAAGRAGETHAIPIARVLDSYAADQAAVTELLLQNPNAYVDTHRYIDSASLTLPTPLLSVELGEFISPLDTFPVNEAVRIPRVVDRDGLRGWNRTVIDLQAPPRPALLDAVLECEFICKLCDVAFSDEALDPIDKEVLLESITQTTGLMPLFVF